MECDIGITGLAVMGANLARNAARKGFAVAVHNRTDAKTDELLSEFGHEGTFYGAHGTESFVAALKKPRAIVMMVKAGKPVDDVIAELVPYLERDDILIDGGNSLFTDTERRGKELAARGIRYLGVGVSGGEVGALEGPSMMPGGDPAAYEVVRPMLERMAAQVDGTPCCTYIGPGGAGHYVKMVHNGIEYADMQLIAEAYDLMRSVYGLAAPAIADVFAKWKDGDLDSYLIEITAEVLRKADPQTGKPLVDVILDAAEQKGTGRWTAQQALEMGSPITAITEAVFARSISALKSDRVAAEKMLSGPNESHETPNETALDAIRDALYASKIVAYAQGFGQMAAASEQFGWKLDLGKIATIWRGGCIIRAKFLDRIKDAYAGTSSATNLLMVPYFSKGVETTQARWRDVASLAVEHGVPIPAFSSALAYYDGYRRANGPANLLQGLRDYFGSHTYRRVDGAGSFHIRWSEGGAEVKTSA
ncbi:MAG: NADP-dependent phosphogluconate dehydrogenase [Candidatus Eremiobacteraeota bacterium]|nr:NADP-dependent phosphogluconate dehydrogenase [Candidatus Eremiobacteraeota bacterium]